MDWTGITDTILAVHGDACVYLTIGGVSTTLTAVISDGVEVVDGTGQVVEQVRVVTIAKGDLASPAQVGDKLTIDGVAHYVQRLLGDDGVAVRLAVA